MLETLKEKWNDILKYLKEEYDISDVSFDTWLLPLEVYALGKLPASNATPSSSL